MDRSRAVRNLSIHLTDRCNNSCIFCVVGSKRESTEMVNKKLVKSFLADNKGKGYEAVNIHGGEPTVCDELVEILDFIKACGYPRITLQTNARRLADKEYAALLAAKGVDLFIVSLHAPNAAIHDYLTTSPGCFREAVQGIHNVKQLDRKVRTNTVACQSNKDMLLPVAELALSIGTDHVNISAVHPKNRAWENFDLVTPRYADIVPQVMKTVDFCTGHRMPVTLEGFPPCVLGEYRGYLIRWDAINYRLLYHNFILEDYADFMEREQKRHFPQCEGCSCRPSCGGVYVEYLDKYGAGEFETVKA